MQIKAKMIIQPLKAIFLWMTLLYSILGTQTLALSVTLEKYFGSQNYDLEVEKQRFSPVWPLKDPKPTIMQRANSLGVLNNEPIIHDGLDIVRSSPSLSKSVFSPVKGYAITFKNIFPKQAHPKNAYENAVFIYDQHSHVLLKMLHVKPSPYLQNKNDPIPLNSGDKIGSLAPATVVKERYESEYRHIDLKAYDLSGKKRHLINPLPYFKGYHDPIHPFVRKIKLVSPNMQTIHSLNTAEPFHIVLDAFDRDLNSKFNLNIRFLQYTLRTSKGEVVSQSEKCDLNSLLNMDPKKLYKFFDLIHYPYDITSSILKSNVNNSMTNPDKGFPYVITRIKADSNALCMLRKNNSFVKVPESVDSLILRGKISDGSNNRTNFKKTFKVH